MSPLPFWQQCVIIALCSLASMLSRSLPFLLFKPGASLPSYIRYLGKALPSAVFALLVVYYLKDVSLLSGDHGIPESHRPPCDHAAPPLETADDALHGRRHDPLHGTCAVCVSLKGAETPSWGSPHVPWCLFSPLSCKKRLDPFESRRFHFGDRYGIRTHTLCAENAAS